MRLCFEHNQTTAAVWVFWCYGSMAAWVGIVCGLWSWSGVCIYTVLLDSNQFPVEISSWASRQEIAGISGSEIADRNF